MKRHAVKSLLCLIALCVTCVSRSASAMGDGGEPVQRTEDNGDHEPAIVVPFDPLHPDGPDDHSTHKWFTTGAWMAYSVIATGCVTPIAIALIKRRRKEMRNANDQN